MYLVQIFGVSESAPSNGGCCLKNGVKRWPCLIFQRKEEEGLALTKADAAVHYNQSC